MVDSRRKTCDSRCPRYEESLGHPCLLGIGPPNADVMFIGENPGHLEDKKGKPFIGRSGKLLDDALIEVGIERKDLFVTNAVKCFTHRDKPKPTDSEIKKCKKYLTEEIKRVKPKLICALGGSAMKAVLKDRKKITEYKNNVYWSEEFKCKVVPVYHPAYILRNPTAYKDFIAGLELVKNEAGTEKIQKKYGGGVKILVADNRNKIKRVLKKLDSVDAFAFDFETSSLDFRTCKIICVSVAWSTKTGVVIPWKVLCEHTDLYDWFRKILKSNKLKINQNIKFDIKVALGNKIKVKGPFWDTMLAHALIDENSGHSLNELVLRYTDYGEYWLPLEKAKQKIAKKNKIKKDDVTYDLIPPFVLYPYSGYDSVAVYYLKNLFTKALKDEELYDFFLEHTMSLMPVLLEMEFRGIHIDRERLAELIKEYDSKIEDMYRDLHSDKNIPRCEELRYKKASKEWVDKYKASTDKLRDKYSKSKNLQSRFPNGIKDYIEYRYPGGVDAYVKKMVKEDKWKFNFNSTQQLRLLFFDVLKLKPIKFTDTKQPSTDKEVLEELSYQGVGIAKKLVEYRKITKYYSTYLVGIYEKSAQDNRIHTSYLQHKAVSGRLASEEPNLQNLPRDAKDLKTCFIADPGYVFLKADLAQAEFRVWAEASGDKKMLQDILDADSGKSADIHTKMAALCFDMSIEDVTQKERTPAKNVVFGLCYGRGTASVARQFGITKEKADYIKEVFFSEYPVAAQWIEDRPKMAVAHGYVETLWGRKRRLPDIYSDNEGVAAEAARQAKNSPIQGQASDMNNAYLVRTVARGRKQKVDFWPALTIHDDNTYQVRKGQVKKLATIMKDAVDEGFQDFKCPMRLDFEIGKTLGELEEISYDEIR